MDTHRKTLSQVPNLQASFLHLAAEEINKQLQQHQRYSGYEFICLNAYSFHLLTSSKFAHFIRNKRCVLVADKNRYALAIYFYHRISSVVTIIDHRMDMANIFAWLSEINGKKRLLPSMHYVLPLNHSDIQLIRRVISGKPMFSIARTMNINIKTLYSRQTRIAHRLGVQNLGRLLCMPLLSEKSNNFTTDENIQACHVEMDICPEECKTCIFEDLPEEEDITDTN